MKKECVYIRGCIFAIQQLIEKGCKSFAVNVNDKTLAVEWSDIIDYLINQYDKECDNE